MADPATLDLSAWRSGVDAVREGRLIELGQIFHAGMPHYPTHPDFSMSLHRRHGDRVRADGASSASCHWSFGGHTGTHVDALCHVSQEGMLADGTVADNDRIERGASPLDAASLAPVLRRGVLFDMALLDGVACLPGDRVLTPGDFERAEQAAGVTLVAGDVALIRTGWSRHWGAPEYNAPETPGPGAEGGMWLADRGVALVGSDTAVFEKGPVTDAAPVHRLLLLEHRIPIMENLALDALAMTGAATFFFAALPLRARGATASPLRPVAII